MAGEERILDWEGALNARDTGGLPTRDGGHIKPGALVRSDVISRLTPSGRAALIAHGVRTIIDIRTSAEIGHDVDYPFRNDRGPTDPAYVNVSFVVPMTQEQEDHFHALRRTSTNLGEFNKLDIDNHRTGIARVIAAVADAQPGGVLVHCMAGKDRTGMTVGLLLRLVGVDPQDVADDYSLTMLNLDLLNRDWLAEVNDPDERSRLQRLSMPRREAMLEMLEYVDSRYGGVESYLRSAGVTDDELARIRERLVEPTGDAGDG